ncbi:MAG: hypothetical protein Q8876_05860 [Bacillota bacterium]|nr:hypothetical protein [Bacillota bacterium]
MNFEIPIFDWFANGNPFGGNVKTFNYKIVTTKENIKVYIWIGKLCLEKSEIKNQKEFELSEQGLQLAIDFINNEYQESIVI